MQPSIDIQTLRSSTDSHADQDCSITYFGSRERTLDGEGKRATPKCQISESASAHGADRPTFVWRAEAVYWRSFCKCSNCIRTVADVARGVFLEL